MSDRAHVAAVAIVQIVEDAMGFLIDEAVRSEVRASIEAKLRDEFADIRRQARADRHLAD